MFDIYYNKNAYTAIKEVVKTVETEQEASRICNIYNQFGGYEAENGKQYFLDYEEV